ncbi:MAG: O-antigen ligase family protein [Bacteroidales bacterium]|nr:O-antigen ligase family protein [Bacteroidales bacterium]MDZ4204637.1 O-antigen ligase family protein [Bacteroidales bacterium]
MASKAKHHQKDKAKLSARPINISFGLIILAYIFIPTFAPNLMTLDTNAPKFLSLALVNLLAFSYIFLRSQISHKSSYLAAFFKTKTGWAYTGLLIIFLLSFTQSTNLQESAVQFVKVFSVFTAALIITTIVVSDLRYIKLIAIIVTGILVFDSLSVFYSINQYINGKISGILEIKSVYSNKNILASSIFVKTAFALWLFTFEKGWLKRVGLLTLFLAFTATLFMATRGFYVGIIFITIVFSAFVIIRYIRHDEKNHIGLLSGYFGALILAVLMFSATQRFYYPDKTSRHTQGVAGQLSTIRTYDASASQRIESWKWSFDLLKKNPLLGVGAGNWKIDILKYENRLKPDYIYLYKAHNDFIETAAETGITGGLLFLALFVLTALTFFRAFFAKDSTESSYKYSFLAASGVLFYSFDAFFNFPADRPEILVMFYLFLGIGIAISYLQKSNSTQNRAKKTQQARPMITWGLGLIAVLLLLASTYIFALNFKSLKLQRTIFQEIKSGKLVSSSNRFLNQFPAIPNVSVWGESISTLKARYLINEQKYEKAIEILRDDLMNPYDGRREFFTAVSFNQLNMPDSALKYSLESYHLKPNYFRNLHLMMTLLDNQGRNEEITHSLDTYLAHEKFNKDGWIYATGFYNKIGEIDKAYELIQEAKQYLPGDSIIMDFHGNIKHVDSRVCCAREDEFFVV